MAAKNGKARLVGVIGDPISHSFSPTIHEYWLNQYGINGAYVPLHVSQSLLPQALNIYSQTGFVGFNVTLPHKQEAFRLMQSHDEPALLCQAVNTIIVGKKQDLHGMNTDSYGFIKMAEEMQKEQDIRFERVLVLGAGGACRAVIHGLMTLGCKQLVVANRNLLNAQQLIEAMKLRLYFEDIKAIELADAAKYAKDVDSIVNTISLQSDSKQVILDIVHSAPKNTAIIDISYGHNGTEMTRIAEQTGHINCDGLLMLLWQAVPGFEQWFGVTPHVDQDLVRLVRKSAGQ